MSMYERYAKDLSEQLFYSVYDQLYELAMSEQKSIFASTGKKGYYVGESQTMFIGFCGGKVSLGEALDHIKLKTAMQFPIKVS